MNFESKTIFLVSVSQSDNTRSFLRMKLSRPFVIGRDTIRIAQDDTSCSRQHALVRWTKNGDLLLEDLGSTNGTWVNGERVARKVLMSGDHVQVGKAKFFILIADPKAHGPSESTQAPNVTHDWSQHREWLAVP